MKYRIDTHIHTTASDGTLDPDELLKEIKKLGINVFSITDHDNIDNINEMINLTENEDLIFIPGVEISVTYLNKEIHLLTYGIDIENKEFLEIINTNTIIRNNFDVEVMKFVAKKLNFDFNEYINYERNPKNGGWKAENFLREKGLISSLRDFFELIEESEIEFVFKPLEEVISKLKKIGLMIVLAHPPAYYKGELLNKEFLDCFRDLGIDGIECFSPYYKNEEDVNSYDADYYIEYCKENNLLIMSGSDYHGAFVPTRKLGVPERYISKDELNEILEKIR